MDRELSAAEGPCQVWPAAGLSVNSCGEGVGAFKCSDYIQLGDIFHILITFGTIVLYMSSNNFVKPEIILIVSDKNEYCILEK